MSRIVKDSSPVARHGAINQDATGAPYATFATTSAGIDNLSLAFNQAAPGADGPVTFKGNGASGERCALPQLFTVEGYAKWTATPASNEYFFSMEGQLFNLLRTNTNTFQLVSPSITTSAGLYTNGNIMHWAITRNASNLVTLWIDGVNQGTVTSATSLLATNAWSIGNLFGGGGQALKGNLSAVRITSGVCRYTAGFTPTYATWPTTVGGDASWESVILLMRGDEVLASDLNVNAPETNEQISLFAFPATLPLQSMDDMQAVWDMENGGLYEIVLNADLTVLNSPSNTPFYGRVDLMEQRTRRVIRSTWSDPVTGAYAFRYIKFDPVAQEPKYTLMGWDHTIAQRRAVIADGQIPDLMTVFP